MADSYHFFGGPLNGERKPMDPSDFPLRVDGGTYRLTGAGHSLGGQRTVYSAVFWPDRDAPGSAAGDAVKVGDPFPLDEANVGDCSAVKFDAAGLFAAACVLDEGHSPAPHIASNGQVIVEVWN